MSEGKSRMRKYVRVVGLLALGAGALSVLSDAQADGIPAADHALVYEGTLERDGVSYDGRAEVLVSLWSEATTGGSPSYADVQGNCGSAGLEGCECAVVQNVAAIGGRFAVPLSADCTAAVGAHPDLWVDVRAVIDGVEGSFGRTRLAAVPYAIEADHTRDSDDGVPVGGIIDWWRPDTSVPPPAGFQICDGSAITTGPWAGRGNVPDLRDRFVRGTNLAGIGSTGGRDVTGTRTTGSAGAHQHIWGHFDDLHGNHNRFDTYNSRGNLVGGDPTTTYSPSLPGGPGTSGARNYLTWQDTPGVNDSINTYTSAASSHRHTYEADLPRYVGLLKLMRIQ